MKITLLFLLLGMVQSYAKSYSQEAKLDLYLKNVPLRKVFRQIEKKSEYRFLFNEKEVSSTRKVNISAAGIPVKDILNQILNNTTLSYKVLGSGLIVVAPGVTAVSMVDLTGSVKDEAGDPVIGATIQVKGANAGTVTDANGNFSLDVPDTAVLVVSYIGFETREVPVNGQTSLEITMSPSNSALDEVVVIGYGTQRVIDNTSAISLVKAKDIVKKKSFNALQGVQGKVAGMQITSSDQPGNTPSVSIRGMGTVLGGRKPLYVIDGMFADNIDNINPQDIESINVLKDASALAIYGNRGANGVIIVTTKSGHGKISVEYDGFVGVRTVLRKVEMANGDLFSKYTNIANNNNEFSENQPVNTNWFDEITRTGIYHQNNVIVSGSSDNVNYMVSLNNYNEKGNLKGNYYNRTTMRTNNKFQVTKGISLSQNLSVAYIKETPKPLSVFNEAYKQAPIVPVRFDDGRYGMPIVNDEGLADPNGGAQFNDVGNPVATIDLDNEKSQRIRLQGGLKLDVDLGVITDGLNFTSQYSGEYFNQKGYNFDNGVRLIGQATPSFNNQLTNTQEDYFNWVWSNYLSYSKHFDIHTIEATLGAETSRNSGLNALNIIRENVEAKEDYWNLGGTNYADNVTTLNSVNNNNETTLSYFGRIQYTLLDRYMITGTLRRDGSSQFSRGNKWGNFPSFGLGWVMSRESFLSDAKFINMLKLRGGWGRLGNQDVPLNIATFASGSNLRYSFDGQTNLNGITIDQIIDPNLGWEITEETSVGLDFAFLENRLSGSLDFYSKINTNVILPSLPVSSAGVATSGFSHLGRVSNRGFEVTLGWADKFSRDWDYSVNLAYSNNKNRLDRVNNNANVVTGGDLRNGYAVKYFGTKSVGQPLGSFYLWQTDGYDDEGNFKYVDQNENGSTGAEDSDDRAFFGSYIPKSTLGLSLALRYRNWDLSIDTYGAFGAKVYNGKKAQRTANGNIEKGVAEDFWTKTNTNAANPAPYNATPLPSTYFLESGDFFRANNITIGYNLENPFDFIGGIRFYLSAENPFIIQSYSGYTPELNADGNPYGLTGVELDAFPALRSFVVGINVKF